MRGRFRERQLEDGSRYKFVRVCDRRLGWNSLFESDQSPGYPSLDISIAHIWLLGINVRLSTNMSGPALYLKFENLPSPGIEANKVGKESAQIGLARGVTRSQPDSC